MPYNVKEEAQEVKKNLVGSRDTFILLVIAGVVGAKDPRYHVSCVFFGLVWFASSFLGNLLT